MSAMEIPRRINRTAKVLMILLIAGFVAGAEGVVEHGWQHLADNHRGSGLAGNSDVVCLGDPPLQSRRRSLSDLADDDSYSKTSEYIGVVFLGSRV